jgi:histidinol-phosphate phosphatase family protein
LSRWLPHSDCSVGPEHTHPQRRTAEAPPALFIDRDGCLIAERHYLSDPDAVELLPGVTAALRRARRAGYLLLGVSNQSGIGRGRFTEEELAAVMERLHSRLAREGAGLDAYYYCPHDPAAGCRCRKPATGLLEEAAQSFVWNPVLSWTIGDKIADVDLGLAAGLGGILVRSGYGRAQEAELGARKDRDDVLVVDNLAAAVAEVLARGPA